MAPEDLVGRRSAVSRRIAALAFALVLAAMLARVLTLPLPAPHWFAELGVGVFALVYSAIVIRFLDRGWMRGDVVVILRGAVASLIAGSVVALAAGYFDGIAILASNLRENIDDAFARRFESIIYFPLPRPEERERLWRRGFSPKATLQPDLDLNRIAHDYPLSGGSIINAIRLASLHALTDNGRPIGRDDVVGAIRRELAKEGRAG